MALDTAYVDELKGLDALRSRREERQPRQAAVGRHLAQGRCGRPRSSPFWQVVVWLHLKPEYVLPAPTTALKEFAAQLTQPTFWQATSVTLTRGVVGFLIASVIGLALGVLVAQVADPAHGAGLADHRAADHALHRVVPAGDPAVPAQRAGDPVRHPHRRGALDRQRRDQRGGLRAAAAGAGRAQPRRHAASRSTDTSSSPRHCRASSPGSSRAGRSPGARCSPAS